MSTLDSNTEALQAVLEIAQSLPQGHQHENKSLLDTYTQTNEDLSDAVSKKHTHKNQSVLDNITSDTIGTWNRAAQTTAHIVAPGMHGVIGDGLTDDSAAIQTAINQNNVVILMPGRYLINNPITIPSYHKVQLEGTVVVGRNIGFIIGGEHIEICGNGTIHMPKSNLNCTGIQFLINKALFFVTLREFTIVAEYSSGDNAPQRATAIEFVGDSSEGQCSFIDIRCSIRSAYRGIYSHQASDQHAETWLTQVNVNAYIEQCVRAVDFSWMGDASQIRGAIQPRCNVSEAGQLQETLITLPAYCYFDAFVWDVDSARNNLIFSVEEDYCTIWTHVNERYMSIGASARKTLTMRKAVDSLMPVGGGTFTGDVTFGGDVRFSGNHVGLWLSKPDGTSEKVEVQQNGFVTAGLATYTNQLPLATDTNRTTRYGTAETPGYLTGYRLSSGNGAVVELPDGSVTGFIPAKPGDIVRVKNIKTTDTQNMYIISFKGDNTKVGHAQWNGTGSSTAPMTSTGIAGWFDMVITLDPTVYGTDFNAIRISSGGFDSSTIITVNEEIDDTFHVVQTVNGRSGNVTLSKDDIQSVLSSEVWTMTLSDGTEVSKELLLK